MQNNKQKMPFYGVLIIIAISISITEYFQRQYGFSNLAYGFIVGACVVGIWALTEKFIFIKR